MFNLSQYCFSCFIIFSTVSGYFLMQRKKHILFQKMCSSTYWKSIKWAHRKATFNFFKGLFLVFPIFSRDFIQFSQLFQGTFLIKSLFFQGTFPFPFRTSHFYSLSIASAQSKKCWSSGSKWSPLPLQYRRNLWKHRYKFESSAL